LGLARAGSKDQASTWRAKGSVDRGIRICQQHLNKRNCDVVRRRRSVKLSVSRKRSYKERSEDA
jgi:hypothetical protein